MKKKVKVILAALLLMSMFTATMAQAADASTGTETVPRMYIDGVLLESDVPPIVLGEDDFYVMVPLRAITEALGYTIEWGGFSQIRIEGNGNGHSTVTIGNQEFWATNRASMVVNAPFIARNRTMVCIWTIRSVFADSVDDVSFDFEQNVLMITTTLPAQN